MVRETIRGGGEVSLAASAIAVAIEDASSGVWRVDVEAGGVLVARVDVRKSQLGPTRDAGVFVIPGCSARVRVTGPSAATCAVEVRAVEAYAPRLGAHASDARIARLTGGDSAAPIHLATVPGVLVAWSAVTAAEYVQIHGAAPAPNAVPLDVVEAGDSALRAWSAFGFADLYVARSSTAEVYTASLATTWRAFAEVR